MSTVDSWISSDKDYTDQVLQLDEFKITKITPQLKAEIEKFATTKRLSLVGCDLRSFENFPQLVELEELDLTDNKFKGEELRNLPQYANLRELSLSSNPIGAVQDLKPLHKFNKTLESLYLQECTFIKNNKAYRKEVFQIIGGSLANVDSEDREGKEIVEESDGEGEDDDGEQDDVQAMLNDEQEDDDQPKVKVGSAKKAVTGENDQDDDEDDDDGDDQDDDEDDFEDDQDDEDDDEDEQNSEPIKQVKRN